MPSWASCLAIIRMPGALEALPPHLPCMPPGAVPGDRIFKNTPQTRLAPNRGFPRRLRLLKKQKIEKLQHREFFHAPAPRPMKRQRHEMGTFGALPRSAETPQKRPRGPRPATLSSFVRKNRSESWPEIGVSPRNPCDGGRPRISALHLSVERSTGNFPDSTTLKKERFLQTSPHAPTRRTPRKRSRCSRAFQSCSG